MQKVRWLVGAQYVVVSAVVLSTPYWVDTRPIKELMFLLSTIFILLVFFWRSAHSKEFTFKLYVIDLPLMCFAAWLFFSLAWAERPYAGLEKAAIFGGLVVVFLLVRSLHWSDEALHRQSVLLCSVSAAVCLVAFAQYFGIGGTYTALAGPFVGTRLSSTMGNPALLAAFLNLSAFCSIGLLCSGLSWRGRVSVTCGLLATVTVLTLAQSRAAVLGLVVGSVVFCMLGRRRFRRSTSYRSVLIVVGLAAAVIGVGAAVFFMRAAALTAPATYSDPVRMHVWQGTVRMILDQPLRGVGAGQFPILFPRYESGERPFANYVEHAHSAPLEAAAELGIPGLGLAVWGLCAFVVLVSRAASRCDPERPVRPLLVAGGVGGIAAAMAQSLVDVNTTWIQSLYPLWLLAGLVMAAVSPYCRTATVSVVTLSARTAAIVRGAVLCLGTAALIALVWFGYRAVMSHIHKHEGQILASAAYNNNERARELTMISAAHLELSVALNPYSVHSWYLLGVQRFRLKMYDGSLEAFKTVLTLNPYHPYAREWRDRLVSHLSLAPDCAASPALEQTPRIARNAEQEEINEGK